MRPEELLKTLSIAAKLKTQTRHCWTEGDRKESVADHSWRMALMAMLLEQEPEFKDVNMNTVMRMCLIHDLGEAFTGDIPTFTKNGTDEATEDAIYRDWIQTFSKPDQAFWMELYEEMCALKTKEAQVYKALDKLEALISHNESDIETWLPLEYDLQKTYGKANMKASPYFQELRTLVDQWTDEKIQENK